MTDLRALQIFEVQLVGVQPLQTHVVQDRQYISGAEQVEAFSAKTPVVGDCRADVVRQVRPREATRQVENDVRARQVQLCSMDPIQGHAQIPFGSVFELPSSKVDLD